jgi:hypothetical protein
MGYRKKNGWDMGNYIPTPEELEAYHWGVNNQIAIAPFAASPSAWWIEISIKGSPPKRSKETYGKNLIWIKIYEFYKYYYDKKDNK